MDAPVLYVVRFWVSPQGGDAVIRWLDSKHMKEVTEQPGFLWSRRCRLEEDAADGWHAYLMIYGVQSRPALEDYFNGAARARFGEEGKQFQHVLRAERAWGTVDARIG